MLPEQVEKGRFDGGDGVHGDAQVERLQAAPARVAASEQGLGLAQQTQVRAGLAAGRGRPPGGVVSA